MGLIPRQTLTVTRESGGTFTNGKWVPGTPSTFTIDASIQPLNMRELELLPEGRRASGESYKLYTDYVDDLLTVTDETPDVVSIYSEDFEVFGKEVWGNGLINHKKYIVTRKTTK